MPLRYQGQYADVETGLYYNRFRYYSPSEGCYTQPDPIGLEGGIVLYRYVHDPNYWLDVFGLSPACQGQPNSKNRKDALRKAKKHAKVPRISRGGEKIPFDKLNKTSRGKNWKNMKSNGGTKLGMKNPKGKNHWFEHPDGHPDAGSPGVPAHHGSGHIHSVNPQGVEIVFWW